MFAYYLHDRLDSAVQEVGAKLPNPWVQLGHYHTQPLLALALGLFNFQLDVM